MEKPNNSKMYPYIVFIFLVIAGFIFALSVGMFSYEMNPNIDKKMPLSSKRDAEVNP